jgi:hypothetical protein
MKLERALCVRDCHQKLPHIPVGHCVHPPCILNPVFSISEGTLKKQFEGECFWYDVMMRGKPRCAGVHTLSPYLFSVGIEHVEHSSDKCLSKCDDYTEK